MPEFEMLNSHDKIYYWKSFRENLKKIENDYEALCTVQKFWEKRGRVHWSLDYDAPEKWIGPWEIINDNVYCRSSLAVMMYYTLHFSDDNHWNHSRLQLKLVEDNDTQETYIVLIVDNRWVLNKSFGFVEDLTKVTENELYNTKNVYKRVKQGFSF